MRARAREQRVRGGHRRNAAIAIAIAIHRTLNPHNTNMVKVQMNTADVAAEVKCLRRLIGMRCSNVYDLTPKTYVFKLMNSSGVSESGESEKVLLLMESGVRLHTTVYMRDKSNTPSGFTLKLRKHIRTRRLEDVRQFGYDRIILFQFGLGENANYVILELYAQENILLTDANFTILTLLRSHSMKGIFIALLVLACMAFLQLERSNQSKVVKGPTRRLLPFVAHAGFKGAYTKGALYYYAGRRRRRRGGVPPP